MNAIVKQDPIQQAEGATLLAVISRAAADPQTDVEKMERLMAMYERIEARRAVSAFDTALSNMQPELPSIGKRGGIKDRNGNVQSTYALWEDINQVIKPVLQKHGFALSFRTDCAEGISVTGVLSHKEGHREETTIKLPADATGSKNAVQAVASSVSYGKRYTAGALLNLTSHGEDDDGFKAGQPSDPVADALFDKIDLSETEDELRKVKDDIKAATLPDKITKTVIGAYNAKLRKLKGGDK